MAAIAASGVGSGLDVTGLVTQLMAAEQAPLQQVQKKQGAATVKISAFGTFKGAISSLQGSLSGLEQAAAYTATSAKVSDTTVATVTSSSGADIGSHSLEVTNLATAQRLKSGTFKNTTDTVGTGTLTLQFGTYSSSDNTFKTNTDRTVKNITIDTAHNTLAGVRDAINAASAGVTASIVNDGTGNRLVVSSTSTGVANSVKIDVTDDDGNNTNALGLSQLSYDPTALAGSGQNLSQVVGAQDAVFKLDGLDIHKASNTVTDVLAGTTINLLKPTVTGAPVTIGVNRDTSGIRSSIDAFVKAYNGLDSTVDTLTAYDPTTKAAGDLSCDATVRSLTGQIRSALTSVVSNVPGGYNALSQVGITLDSTGQLQVDSTKLQKALDTNPVAVQGLFATTAYSKDSLVSYSKSNTSTPPGNYNLNLTQLATQSQVVGSAPATLAIDSTNNTFDVSVRGVTASISLNQKTYNTPEELGAELQSQLNASTPFKDAGITVSVTQASGVLSLNADAYGSESKIVLSGGAGQDALFGATPTNTDGLDIAGSLGGSLATGAGQTLTASNGLAVSVAGGATGERGTVTFTRGVAVQLDNLLTNVMSSKGVIAGRINSLNTVVKNYQDQAVKINAQLDAKKAQYTAQFNTLDGLLTSMQSTMSFLTQQLSSLKTS